MPQFKGKQHSESPNESTLLQPCNKLQTENQKTSVTDKMKISTDISLKKKNKTEYHVDKTIFLWTSGIQN